MIESYDLTWVKEEMYEVQANAEVKLRDIVHPEYLKNFLGMLNFAWNCNDEHANKLAKDLNLSRKEFVALEGDLDLFMQIQLEELFC